MTQPLLIEHNDRVDRVTLNRPESLSVLNPYFEGLLCSRSEDFGEGIRAFLEKRKPVYIRR